MSSPLFSIGQQVGEFSPPRMADFGAAMTTADEGMLQGVLEELNVSAEDASDTVPKLAALGLQRVSGFLVPEGRTSKR